MKQHSLCGDEHEIFCNCSAIMFMRHVNDDISEQLHFFHIIHEKKLQYKRYLNSQENNQEKI